MKKDAIVSVGDVLIILGKVFLINASSNAIRMAAKIYNGQQNRRHSLVLFYKKMYKNMVFYVRKRV